MNRSADLKYMEELFTSIKSNSHGSHSDELRNIQRIIKRRYDLNVEINIVKNENLQFFGMSIYPSEDVIDKMVDEMIKGKRMEVLEDLWGKNKNWVIDIDSLLLYDTRINANPSEIVAVLLHEIGHTVRSNEIPQRVGRIVKYSYMHLPINVKKVFQWYKARKVLGFTIIEACSNKNFHAKGVREEVAADKFVIKEGYGNDLLTFINKLIAKSGNKLIDRPESEMEKEIETIMTWVVSNVAELDFRKNVLNKNLQAQILQNRSPFIRSYIDKIRSQFYGDTTDQYRSMMIQEGSIKEHRKYTVTTEAFKNLFNRYGKIEKVTNNDIDMILIEANRIQNENDRVYVLELVYAKMDIIDLSLDLLSNSDTADRVQVTKSKLLEQQKELMDVRKQIMSLKFPPKNYELIVSYPSGYEG